MPKDISLFRDYFQLVKPSNEDISKWKDSISDSSNDNFSAQVQTKRGLEVTFEATHSALYNDNLRLYIPSRMEDGAETFIKRNKPAKILKHHDTHSDPIGIITGSEYVHTIPESFQNNKDVMILTDSSNSLSKQVQAAKRLLKSGITFSEGWRGLGYIKLKGIISDKVAIEQILDGRFDAVSTSFRSPGQVFCSECTQNLAQDGFCEHKPGEPYDDEGNLDPDGTVCALIPGVYKYDEVSLVVLDGDPLTQIVIGHQDSKQEYTISMDNWKETSKGKSSNVEYSFRDFKEEINMADSKNIVDPNVALDDDTANQEVNGDSICDEMQVELKKMLDEKLITEEEWEIADKQLNAEQRKKLPETVFCGPNRSFPVLDCVHVTAARRLIDRLEGFSDEVTINKIDRKAKALGYDTEDGKVVIEEPQVDTFEVPTCEALVTLSDEDAKQLFNVAEAVMLTRNLKLDRPCGKCAAHEDEANKHKEALNDSEVKREELKNQLTVLREELRYQIADYMAQVDRYVELGITLTTTQKDHLALVGTLTGKFKDVESAMDSLNTLDITEQKPVIMADFKLEDIMSKLNDGMTRDPKEVIGNPIEDADKDNTQLPDTLSYATTKAIETIRDFVKNNDIASAMNFYGKMVGLRVIDEKLIPFNSLSAKPQEIAE